MSYFKDFTNKLVNSLFIQYKPNVSGNSYERYKESADLYVEGKAARKAVYYLKYINSVIGYVYMKMGGDDYEREYGGHKELSFTVKVKNKKGEEKELSLQYFMHNKFDKEKKTVIIFHDDYIPSLDGSHFKDDTSCNYLLMQYLPYKYPDLMKDYDVNLEFMVNTSSQMLDQLESVLASDEYYGKHYKRNEQLIFNGDTLGSIIATKVAAEKAKNAQKGEKIFNAIINHSCPLNISPFIKKNLSHCVTKALLATVLFALFVVYPIAIAGFMEKIIT